MEVKPIDNADIENVIVEPSNVVIPEKELREVKQEEVEVNLEETLNPRQFAINIMKGIAGTGILTIPYAFYQVGFIAGICLYIAVTALYSLSSFQLISVVNDRKVIKGQELSSNDYANLCYGVLGKVGYYVFLAASILDLYGGIIGTLVVMTDFICGLPWFNPNSKTVRIVVQSCITLLSIFVCLLKNPRVIVMISSCGLTTLIISIIIVFIYGFQHNGIHLKSEYWTVTSFKMIVTNLGLFVYSLGFSVLLLTQLKHLQKKYHKKAATTTTVAISIVAFIYVFAGMMLVMLFENANGTIPGNILSALPSNSVQNVVISIGMFISLIGSVPLFLEPANEILESHMGEQTYGKVFISNKKRIISRIAEIVLLSVVGYAFPNFTDILNLVGSFIAIVIAFSFPAILHFVYYKKTLSTFMKVVDISVFILSIILIIVCFGQNLIEIFTRS